jgi:hypothetical protein
MLNDRSNRIREADDMQTLLKADPYVQGLGILHRPRFSYVHSPQWEGSATGMRSNKTLWDLILEHRRR